MLFAIVLFWLSSYGEVYTFGYDIRHSMGEYMLLLMLGSRLRVLIIIKGSKRRERMLERVEIERIRLYCRVMLLLIYRAYCCWV